MTRVDFYVLSDTGQSVEVLACKLAEKAYGMGHKVFLHVDGPERASRMDDLLWTFRQGSFVPHEIYSPNEPPQTQVVVGHDPEPEVEPDVLINLAGEVPLFFSRFERVAEIVGPDPDARQASRERFRFYRERGYPMQTHKL